MCNSYRFDKDKARRGRIAGVLKEPWTEKIDLLPSEVIDTNECTKMKLKEVGFVTIT